MTVTSLFLAVAFTAMLVSGFLVPLLVRFAVGRNLMDLPNTRSSHKVPTPRLGGVAVITWTWAGFTVLYLMAPEVGRETLPLVAAATVAGGVGLADDFVDLHFGVKAALQVVAVVGLLVVSPPPVLAAIPPGFGVGLLALGAFWVVALCNAFNFMDGIDGITGGVTVISGLFLASIAGGTAGLLVALVGAMVGFLVWNIGPATIFLGDAGSYFTGFALAVAVLYAPVGEGGVVVGLSGFIAGVVIFTPYLFDTGFTILRRLKSGAGSGVFTAHREHIYQRITPEPAMHRRTSNIYYGLSALCGFGALAASSGGGLRLVLGFGIAALCCALMLGLPRFADKS
ncbi:MAG: glycosyltransferase family 4 protein [Rubrobacter sp.]